MSNSFQIDANTQLRLDELNVILESLLVDIERASVLVDELKHTGCGKTWANALIVSMNYQILFKDLDDFLKETGFYSQNRVGR